MSDEDRSWVAVAVCLRPHALRGIIKLKALTRSEEEFLDAPLERVFVRRHGKIEGALTFESLELKTQGLLAAFVEVPDRTAAEKLQGAELVIPEEELWPAPEGSWYTFELEGLEVRTSAGDVIGKVKRVTEGAANDMLVLPNPEKPKQEVLIPLVPEFVKKVDVEDGHIIVELPKGLLDI